MGLRILVAEDEFITAVDLCDTFEEAGYVIEGPHAGISAALLACQKHKPDDEARELAARFPLAVTVHKPCPPADLLDAACRLLAPA
jgi:hypothetical protein